MVNGTNISMNPKLLYLMPTLSPNLDDYLDKNTVVGSVY